MGIQKQLENKNVTSVVLLISNNMQRFNTSIPFLPDVTWPSNNIYRAVHICHHCVYKPFNPWLKGLRELIWYKRHSWLQQLFDGFTHNKKVLKVSRTTGTQYTQYWKPSWHAFYPILFHQFSCKAWSIKGNRLN